jgi:hypothetical protein
MNKVNQKFLNISSVIKGYLGNIYSSEHWWTDYMTIGDSMWINKSFINNADRVGICVGPTFWP